MTCPYTALLELTTRYEVVTFSSYRSEGHTTFRGSVYPWHGERFYVVNGNPETVLRKLRELGNNETQEETK